MGGERASTTRRRERGEICCVCRKMLDPPTRRGERFCDDCGPKHRVYMGFFERVGWVCNFLEPDLKTSIGPIRTLRTEQLLRDTIQKGSTMDSEARCMLDYAISKGRGAVWLELSREQYLRLKR